MNQTQPKGYLIKKFDLIIEIAIRSYMSNCNIPYRSISCLGPLSKRYKSSTQVLMSRTMNQVMILHNLLLSTNGSDKCHKKCSHGFTLSI